MVGIFSFLKEVDQGGRTTGSRLSREGAIPTNAPLEFRNLLSEGFKLIAHRVNAVVRRWRALVFPDDG
jgi:hypothetical protein